MHDDGWNSDYEKILDKFRIGSKKYDWDERGYFPVKEEKHEFEDGSIVIESKKEGLIEISEVDHNGVFEPLKSIDNKNLADVLAAITSKSISTTDINLFNDSIKLELKEKFNKVIKEVKEKYATSKD